MRTKASPVEVVSSSSADTVPSFSPTQTPLDLFDLNQAEQQISEKFGGIHYTMFNSEYAAEMQALKFRARESAFYYDETVFQMALDLMNRDQAIKNHCSNAVSRILSLPLPTNNDLPLRCLDCKRSFKTKEHATHCIAEYHSNTLLCYRCLGCVGCNLALTHGIDQGVIQARLLYTEPFVDDSNTATPQQALTPGWLTELSKSPHWREDCPMAPFTKSCAHLTCVHCKCYACNGPAAECSQWKESHCHAIHGVHTWDLQHEQNNPEEINPAFYDFLEEKLPGTESEQKALQTRACNAQFIYEDDHAMMLALELYNRKLCTLSASGVHPALLRIYANKHGITEENVYGWGIRDRVYSRFQIRGIHKTPCSQCGRSFNEGSQTLYFARFTGREKVCVGCMGRNLCSLFGSRRATILKQLEECRFEQRHRMADGCVYLQNTTVQEYNRARDFLAKQDDL